MGMTTLWYEDWGMEGAIALSLLSTHFDLRAMSLTYSPLLIHFLRESTKKDLERPAAAAAEQGRYGSGDDDQDAPARPIGGRRASRWRRR